ncbi:MAG: zinc ribbon domain-containing protein [Chloroflexota bacterium]
MSDLASIARKFCPQCGSANLRTAKHCTHCGYAFPTRGLVRIERSPRKRCAVCNHENRLGAKVCTQCGYQFKGAEAEPQVSTETPSQTSAPREQKWCPRCGNVCKLDAKVCTRCGHRFRTNFAPSPDVTEAPITQNPAAPLTLPQAFEMPTRLPDPPASIPSKPASASSAPAEPRTPTSPLEGEAAPEISQGELDAMRRVSPENLDPYGRLVLSLFKKGRR